MGSKVDWLAEYSAQHMVTMDYMDSNIFNWRDNKDRQIKIGKLLNIFKDDEIKELKKEIELLKNGQL